MLSAEPVLHFSFLDLPSSQYGSVAVLPGTHNPNGTSSSIVSVGTPNVDYVANPAGSSSIISSGAFSVS